MKNLFDQEPWQRRGGYDAQLAAADATASDLDDRLATAEFAVDNMGMWVGYTPALTADITAPSLGTGATQHGRYTRIGNTIIGKFLFYFGTGSTSGSGIFRIGLPVAPYLPPADHYSIGTGYVYNTDNGNIASLNYYIGATYGTFCTGIIHEATAATVDWLGPTTPFSTGWTPGDRILGKFEYEAAS